MPSPPRAPPEWSLLEPIQQALTTSSVPSRKRPWQARSAAKPEEAEPDWVWVAGALWALPAVLAAQVNEVVGAVVGDGLSWAERSVSFAVDVLASMYVCVASLYVQTFCVSYSLIFVMLMAFILHGTGLQHTRGPAAESCMDAVRQAARRQAEHKHPRHH